MRKSLSSASALALIALAPASADAQDLSWGVGFDVMSEYVSQGLQLSDGIAFSPYVELYFGSVYAGVYAINTERDLTLSDYEAGIYLGHAGEAGALSYDASIYYYFFNEPFGNAFPTVSYHEVVLSGSYGLTDALSVTGRAGLAPEFDQVDLSLAVDYATPVDGLSVDAIYGTVDTNFGAWDYWSVGGSYAVSDNVTLDLSYHDSNAGPAIGSSADGLFVATVSFYFP